MRLPGGFAMLMLLLFLLLSAKGSAQDSLSSQQNAASYLRGRFSLPQFSLPHDSIHLDSSIRNKLTDLSIPVDLKAASTYFPAYSIPAVPGPSKSFFQVGNGYISYTWTYRSGNDSSVIDNNVSQHLVTGSFNATIAQAIPLRITYFERQSNSPFFKDFRDVTIDVDINRYRQLKTQKALTNLKRSRQNGQDLLLPSAMQAVDRKLNQYRDLLNDPTIATQLIRSRETLIRTDFADTTAHSIDSVKTVAKRFIELYDTLQAKHAAYTQLHDSLNHAYQHLQQQTKKLERLLNSNSLSRRDIDELAVIYGSNDKNIQQLRNASSGFRKLSVGRTYPAYTNLTLQNVNVNGINLEYSKGHYYFAASAGLVDFRIRDFLFSQQPPTRQYVYAARVGYGTRESDHLLLTYFRGRKQLFGGNLQRPAADIQGISVAGQFFIDKHTRLYGEIAQSGVPYALGGNNSAKPAISLTDRSQRAYALGFASYFPRAQTSLEGYYQHSGINYQSFNSFQYNAETNSWSLRFAQYMWKRQLALQASFRKNDFVNPLVLQRYNANTVFKNFTVTFRKPGWPVLSAGYLPASQYTVVGNQVYENHYQTFTGNISHQYKLGIARAATLLSFSQFFNDHRDSGLVYYNSKNLYVAQTFLFTRFTASVNVSAMNNGRHQLIVLEEGLSATFFKTINAGVAIKINNLNKTINKIGFNARTRISLRKIGELNGWMEQSYLPGLQQEFYKYEMYNIGLVRYFK